MSWRAATWILAALAVAGAFTQVARGDIHCGDRPDGCPDDVWPLMDPWAQAGLIVAIVSATAAAVSLLHPQHRGRRLGLGLLTVGLAGAGVVVVLSDHGDLPEPPATACDDTLGPGAERSTKCAPDWDAHWTSLFAVPALMALAGAGVLVGQAGRLAWTHLRATRTT